MARSKADLGGVGKPLGGVPAEPVGAFFLGANSHPVIPGKVGSHAVARNDGDPSFRWDDEYGSIRQRTEDIAIFAHDPIRCVDTGATTRR